MGRDFLKFLGNRVKDTNEAMGRGLNTMELLGDATYAIGKSRPVKATAKAYGRSLVKKDPHDQNFGNAFTGFQEGGGLIASAAVLGGAYATYGSVKAVAMPDKTGEVSYTGTAAIHNADGVSNAPTLGAQGSMVFGMHQGRKR